MVQSGDEKLLRVADFHIGNEKAERYVKHLMKRLGIPVPKGKDYRKDLLFDYGDKKISINVAGLINETKQNGVPHSLQLLADSRDRYLPSPVTMAIGKLQNGLKAKMTSSLGRFDEIIEAPGIIESPESALANDILYFRRMTCEYSDIKNIDSCVRYFRSYLLCCISLIDCFLSRYTNFVEGVVDDMNEYSNTSVLSSTSGIEKRINAWFVTFAANEIDNYKQTTEWLHFQRIREKRNMFVHPSSPIASYSIKEIEKQLNYCNKGIGGLLGKFRIYTKDDPCVGFIQKVKTAPMVTMCKK